MHGGKNVKNPEVNYSPIRISGGGSVSRGNIKQQALQQEGLQISKRKANWIGHFLRRNCLLQKVTAGKIKRGIEVTGRRGRRRRKLLDDVKERRGYFHLKEEDLDRTMWRARFGRGFGPVVRQTTKWMNPTGNGLVMKMGLAGKGLAWETARPTSSMIRNDFLPRLSQAVSKIPLKFHIKPSYARKQLAISIYVIQANYTTCRVKNLYSNFSEIRQKSYTSMHGETGCLEATERLHIPLYIRSQTNTIPWHQDFHALC